MKSDKFQTHSPFTTTDVGMEFASSHLIPMQMMNKLYCSGSFSIFFLFRFVLFFFRKKNREESIPLFGVELWNVNIMEDCELCSIFSPNNCFVVSFELIYRYYEAK